MITISRIEGQAELDRELVRIINETDDLRGAWKDINRLFEEKEARLFASEGGTGESGQWQPLSAATTQWKALRFPGSSILVRTGRMRASLTSRTPDSIQVEEPKSFQRGTSLNYARYHQEGRSRLPRRRVIDFTRQDYKDFGDALTEFSRQRANKTKFKVT